MKKKENFLKNLRVFLSKKKVSIVISILAFWLALFYLASISLAMLGIFIYLSLTLLLGCICFVVVHCVTTPFKTIFYKNV